MQSSADLYVLVRRALSDSAGKELCRRDKKDPHFKIIIIGQQTIYCHVDLTMARGTDCRRLNDDFSLPLPFRNSSERDLCIYIHLSLPWASDWVGGVLPLLPKIEKLKYLSTDKFCVTLH